MRKSDTAAAPQSQVDCLAEELLGPLKIEPAYIEAFEDICRIERTTNLDLYRLLTKAVSKKQTASVLRSFCVYYFATYPHCRLGKPSPDHETYSTSEKVNAFKLYSLAVESGSQAGTLSTSVGS